MLPSDIRTADVRRYADMPRDFAFRRWLASTSIIVALLMADCSALKNTPAQDEASSRWAACRSQVTGSEIRIVQLDGRIMFWSNGTYDGRSMLDCLARAAKNGPALPEAIYEIRPRGG
jgi:hypothetical protein